MQPPITGELRRTASTSAGVRNREGGAGSNIRRSGPSRFGSSVTMVHGRGSSGSGVDGSVVTRKVMLVGDVSCGKTALLGALAGDPFRQGYVPSVFDSRSVTLNGTDGRSADILVLDNSGSSHYDTVRPLSYQHASVVLLCFDISRPETLHSIHVKWHREAKSHCPSAHLLLVGCKSDLRLSKSQRMVSHHQASESATQLGAMCYVECSAKDNDTNSVRDALLSPTTAQKMRRQHQQRTPTDTGCSSSADAAGSSVAEGTREPSTFKRTASKRLLRRLSLLRERQPPRAAPQEAPAPEVERDKKNCAIM
ncbi:rho-related GTP-binding protein RhoN-like [Petromyzon marinus]|uniref:Rho-related GTP-binding protein RhoN-like n=1 Tax=Petromyzon marinus TaxID=7757 RepID=A0AAJ7T980_PETMA|nr:rho-related GTP-binding protein RhoN-like [Petromyzon marinus]